MERIPPMITSQASTAITAPETQVDRANSLFQTTAMEFGCVNGVVVSAATPATSPYVQPRAGLLMPSRRYCIGPAESRPSSVLR
jgi:hypothetical protein